MQPIGADTPSEYLDAVVDLIEEKAYFANRVAEWPKLRAQAHAMLRLAKTPADTYPAIEMVIERLKHRHTYLIPADAIRRNPGQVHNLTYGFSVLRNERRIVQVIAGSPADYADIMVGDSIIAIDDELLKPDDPLPDFDQMQRSLKLTLAQAASDDTLYALLTPRAMVRDTLPLGKRLGDWGYLELPGLHDEPNYDMYIRIARDFIETVSSGSPVKGWIVDVRRNQGGNIWPMLAAVGTLLGSGTLGKFKFRDGTEARWHFADGAALMDNEVMETLALEPEQPDYSNVPIAVIHSPMTADAGEMLVIAFKGRSKTRMFGKPTSGLPTLNTDFPLTDGAFLALTVAACADSNDNIYLDSLNPQEEVATDWATFGGDTDLAIQKAIDWLQTQVSE